MGKKMELSTNKRAQIFILNRNGLSQRQIAAQLFISVSCVSRTLQRISGTGSNHSRSRSGRPPVSTPQTDRLIHRFACVHPFASTAEI